MAGCEGCTDQGSGGRKRQGAEARGEKGELEVFTFSIHVLRVEALLVLPKVFVDLARDKGNDSPGILIFAWLKTLG